MGQDVMIGQRVRFADGEMGHVCRVTPIKGAVGTVWAAWAMRDGDSKMEPSGFEIVGPAPSFGKPAAVPNAVLPGCEGLLGDKARKRAGLDPAATRRWDG